MNGNFDDPYPRALQQTYGFLAAKYRLTPLAGKPFRFYRLRPASFPTLRLAQLSALYLSQRQLFSKVIEARTPLQVKALFQVAVPSYWRNHYVFDKVAPPREKRLSEGFIQRLYTHALLPVSYLYYQRDAGAQEAAYLLRMLGQMPPEKNAVIRYFQQLGIKPQNALEAQALLQLKKSYCGLKKCLCCGMGREILSR